MFFQANEKLEKLGKNSGPVRIFVSGKKKNRYIVFRYLEDHMVDKRNDVSEHHCSLRPDLLSYRFKTGIYC